MLHYTLKRVPAATSCCPIASCRLSGEFTSRSRTAPILASKAITRRKGTMHRITGRVGSKSRMTVNCDKASKSKFRRDRATVADALDGGITARNSWHGARREMQIRYFRQVKKRYNLLHGTCANQSHRSSKLCSGL